MQRLAGPAYGTTSSPLQEKQRARATDVGDAITQPGEEGLPCLLLAGFIDQQAGHHLSSRPPRRRVGVEEGSH